jgi:hypothetical protein
MTYTQTGEKFKTIGEIITHIQRFPEWFDTLTKEQQQKTKEFLVQYQKNYLENVKHNPIYFFRPNLPQSKLIYAKNKQGQMPRILMFEGANKTGKTTFGVAWQIAMGVGFFPWLDKQNKKHPWHFDVSKRWKVYDQIRDYCGFESWDQLSEEYRDIKKLVPNFRVPNVNLAVGETFTESVDKDLVPKYKELIPDTWKPEYKKNQQGVIHKITLKAGPGKGTVFYFRSYKSHDDEFEGIDTSGSVLFNEPPPEGIVTAVMRGSMPYDTRVMFAYTALKEPWLYRNFVNKAATWLI